MAEEVAGLAQRIIEAAAADHGGIPQKIVIEPNGTIEVNVRCLYRDRTHPATYHKRLEREIRSQKR